MSEEEENWIRRRKEYNAWRTLQENSQKIQCLLKPLDFQRFQDILENLDLFLADGTYNDHDDQSPYALESFLASILQSLLRCHDCNGLDEVITFIEDNADELLPKELSMKGNKLLYFFRAYNQISSFFHIGTYAHKYVIGSLNAIV